MWSTTAMNTCNIAKGLLACGLACLHLALGNICLGDEDAVDWEAKYHALQVEMNQLVEERDQLRFRGDLLLKTLEDYKEALPQFDMQFGVQKLTEVDFRQNSLADVVRTINQHLQSEEARNIEHPVQARELRIQELRTEIDSLRAINTNTFVREIRLDLPKGMTGGEVTFSALEITCKEALSIATDVAGVTYQVEGDIIRILPKVSERPIPKDKLSAETVKEALDSIPYSMDIYFTEPGLAKAIAEKLVETRTIDGAANRSNKRILTESGVERFRHLIMSDRIDKQQPIFVDSRRRSDHCFTSKINGAFCGGASFWKSGRVRDVVVGGVRLFRALAATNETASLILRDYESDEIMPIDWADLESNFHEKGDFVPSVPMRGPGIYVYYHLDIEQIRTEDEAFFHHRQYRCDRLHEHEQGYFVRLPRDLQSDLTPSLFSEDPFNPRVW